MKNKLILLFAVLTLILLTFSGCRDLKNNSSTAASSGMNITSAVSGVESGLVSGGKELASQVSGVVSGVVSSVTSAVSS